MDDYTALPASLPIPEDEGRPITFPECICLP